MPLSRLVIMIRANFVLQAYVLSDKINIITIAFNCLLVSQVFKNNGHLPQLEIAISAVIELIINVR